MERLVFKLNDLHRQSIACVSLRARRRGEFLGYPCTRQHRQSIACASLQARRRGEFLGYPCTRHRQSIACASLQARRRGEFLGYPCTRPRNVYTARVQFFRIPFLRFSLGRWQSASPLHPPSKSIFLNLPSLNSDHRHRKIAHDRAVKPCGCQRP